MTEQGRKSGPGCLFYGGIIATVMLLVLILASYLGYRYAQTLIGEFTDSAPAKLPTVTLSSEDMSQLENRLREFKKALDERKPSEPLTLTADEINALIGTQPELQPFKDHMHFTLEGNQVKAQISFPADHLGLRPLRGRYINASGTFRVSLQDGSLDLHAESLSVKGKPLPENLMRHFRAQRFATQPNNDPETRSVLEKLQAIEIKDGKVIVQPKASN
jgi:hypothetical protein